MSNSQHNTLKNILIFAFAIALSFVSYKLFELKKELIEKADIVAWETPKQSQIAERFTANDSVKHVIYTEVYATKNIEKSIATNGYVDSLAKALSISVNRIEELTRVKATVKDKVKLQLVDSVNNRTYSYNGKWLKAVVSPADTSLNYTYNVELINSRYSKGNWLTGKRYYNDIAIADPNARVNSIERFTIPPDKVRRLGLGLQLGYRYDFESNKVSPSIGLGLSYNFIRF